MALLTVLLRINLLRILLLRPVLLRLVLLPVVLLRSLQLIVHLSSKTAHCKEETPLTDNCLLVRNAEAPTGLDQLVARRDMSASYTST